ncbi:hypothetical protein [Fibrobacter sp. UWH4]|uniref:hypothetical protein n=1 Tax=Fibrobacter sp. UWH4 TaxID=1896210 RepID=UPI000917D505|nr:hypothetical protein [Fibrobacter sp. UWH4]SHL06616.1 hypothetical protein SAMN05720762_10497 [Fibrobacter sp. UWH4]
MLYFELAINKEMYTEKEFSERTSIEVRGQNLPDVLEKAKKLFDPNTVNDSEDYVVLFLRTVETHDILNHFEWPEIRHLFAA